MRKLKFTTSASSTGTISSGGKKGKSHPSAKKGFSSAPAVSRRNQAARRMLFKNGTLFEVGEDVVNFEKNLPSGFIRVYMRSRDVWVALLEKDLAAATQAVNKLPPLQAPPLSRRSAAPSSPPRSRGKFEEKKKGDPRELVSFDFGDMEEDSLELGGLEDDVTEEDMEAFRAKQIAELEKGKKAYEAKLKRLKRIVANNVRRANTLYKASDVSIAELRARGGWKIRSGTDDFEQHLIGMQSVWISTSTSQAGAENFRKPNKLPFIYELKGPFTGIDANRFIDELGDQEHLERKANKELALTVDIKPEYIKRVWTVKDGWKAV